MRKIFTILFCSALLLSAGAATAEDLHADIASDYDSYLAGLFDYFHRNPELSLVENSTAARMANELSSVGFEVTEGVGGTGVVALMHNGDGPLPQGHAEGVG